MITSIVVFTLCAIALVVGTLILHAEDREASVTALFDRMMADRTMRVAIIVMWWWLGWHFLAGQTL